MGTPSAPLLLPCVTSLLISVPHVRVPQAGASGNEAIFSVQYSQTQTTMLRNLILPFWSQCLGKEGLQGSLSPAMVPTCSLVAPPGAPYCAPNPSFLNGSLQLGHPYLSVLNQHNQPWLHGLLVLRWGREGGCRLEAASSPRQHLPVNAGWGCSQTHLWKRDLGWAREWFGAAPGTHTVGQLQHWGDAVRRVWVCLGWDMASSSRFQLPSAPEGCFPQQR